MDADICKSTLRQLSAYFLKLGATCFGGPAALAAAMEHDLVTERHWIAADEYKQGFALAQLCPGPLACQLAIYIGYIHSGIAGATATAVSFIAPSFIAVLAIAAAYVRLGGMRWMHSAFYGIGAAVIAIVAYATISLTRSAVGKRPFLWSLYAAAAMLTLITHSVGVWIFITAGFLSLLVYAPPRPHILRADLWTLFFFFAKSGALVFGGGFVIVSFLYGGVVEQYHWLTERQFLDAVAVAMITPGPVVIAAAFIGYLAAGCLGAFCATAGVLLPVYILVLILTPWFKTHGRQPQVAAFVEGVTAAAIGALAGSVLTLARGAIVDWPTILIALGAGVLIFRYKTPAYWIVVAAGLIGMCLHRV